MKYNSITYVKHKIKLDNLTKQLKSYKCKLCGKEIKSISAFTTHMLRHHFIDIDDYIFQNLQNIKPEFKIEKCNFCHKHDAQYTIHFNMIEGTYYCDYVDGYSCNTDECINSICLKYFNEPYLIAKHKYEHIGAKTDFIATRYKLSHEYVKKYLKRDPNFKHSDSTTTSLNSYILRYGKTKGTNLYKERCKKIAYSMTVDWYIEKYGIDKGTKKYQERIEKTLQYTKDIIHSKNQYLLFNELKNRDYNWEAERFVGGVGIADMVNKTLKVAVEYFGDYWHCNPLVYKDDYFNKSLKLSAKECQEKDKIRLTKMITYSKQIDLIIVVWEQKFTSNKLNDIINQIEKYIQQHKEGIKEILWI